MNGSAVYVFGVVADDHPAQPAELVGLGGPDAAVWRVPAGSTAGVVAAAPGWLRARPRDLLAHQLVLDCLWQGGPVLPARYGTVAPDEQTLRAALRGCASRHLDALAQVAGRVEVDVGVHPATGTGDVYEALRPLAVRASDGRFLVEEDTVDTFLSRVAALDHALAGRGRVRATGPLPPYSFTARIDPLADKASGSDPLLDRSG
ncbi:GvpL/GvpF family gas vesicle protein [Phytohabitans sp. ZYX-F-186]|uniref:GvpL/GvpF family gas vesicle protein n=1 Tax=Phytohabitans maris TaxID=3071409 RepID=A0ABU0ZHA8_9ACTN|nr:GvpL/GvpF family gas vesicle protein [Phytohabitans sp. ZYX-F-186]MDQ7906368.1 GvpL/GvpF family gas vesicle protein [Phytohabitans sp. ZYX-F-186]